jgi:hypothetical protein
LRTTSQSLNNGSKVLTKNITKMKNEQLNPVTENESPKRTTDSSCYRIKFITPDGEASIIFNKAKFGKKKKNIRDIPQYKLNELYRIIRNRDEVEFKTWLDSL